MSLEQMNDEEIVEQETVDQEPVEIPEVDETPEAPEPTDEEQDTFPRDYVEKLRDENAKYRQRAQKADDLAHRLHNALAAATGRLQDASDLEYSPEHLDDPEALDTAITELLEKKPHLGSRKPSGSIGQGVSAGGTTVDLAGLLRQRA
ncbi:hypothetical protein QYM46_13405 [Brevibacterium sp. K11IcPPYGO002]|uniref:hypothetical protein n=1 Tax=Brevibacterium sp. K11IcPPYGO002 TaxID=3058837 RepID=UPI003D81C355